MIKKKICMLGAFAVGKTSLVQQFVRSIFSESYLSTVGVRVDKKSVVVDDRQVDLIVWDIHGEDSIQSVAPSYLRGAAGFLVVADGTRRETLGVVEELIERVRQVEGDQPIEILINKADLADKWEIGDPELAKLEENGRRIRKTSARTGEGVEDAFLALARSVLNGSA